MEYMENGPNEIISFEQDGRKYRCRMFPIDQLPPPGIGRLAEFYRIWKAACKDRKFPASSDLSFEDLKGWHSSLRTVEYGDDLYAPKKIKIMGELFEKYWGKEAMYDRIQSDNPPSQQTIDNYYQYLQCFYDDHYCISTGIIPEENGVLQKINWIDLPLSDDGIKVTHVIGALLPEEQNIL